MPASLRCACIPSAECDPLLGRASSGKLGECGACMGFEVRTTATEVINRFAGRSKSAAARLASWRRDPDRVRVVEVVESHVSVALYDVTAADIERVCQETDHALGDIRKAEVQNVLTVRDWYPAFAFTHVFHHALERLGDVPTYQVFRRFCSQDETAQEMLTSPARAVVAAAEESPTYDASQVRNAVQWRVGNAYYSFLREIYVFVALREGGVDLRMHPLADALFRVDAWVDDLNLDLYVGNLAFRAGQSGRKLPSADILRDADPPFRFLALELAPASKFGQVHLPSEGEIARIADAIAGPAP